MGRTVLQRRTRRALLLSGDALRRLTGAISQVVPCSLDLRLSDGLVREEQSIDDVAALPNSSAERVESLKWEGRSQDTSVEVAVDNGDASFNVAYIIRGSDIDTVRVLRNDVDAWISENAAPYRPLAQTSVVVPLTLDLVAGFLGLFAWAHITGYQSDPRPDGPTRPGVVLLLLAVGPAPLWLGIPLERLRAILFPMLEVTTGYGQGRYKKLSFIRSGILLAIALASP